MKLSGAMFDAVNQSQDNSPLRSYAIRRAETMLGEYELHVGDCVSETIYRCFESADNYEEVLTHLQYAAHELTKAAMSARRSLLEEVSGG